MNEIEHLTSVNNPKIKAIRALHMRKGRKETGLFLAEGLRSVIEGLECGHTPKQLVFSDQADKGGELQKAIDKTLAGGGQVFAVSDAVLEKLSKKDNPQMALGVFEQVFHALPALEAKKTKCLVALEEVRDPGNLGTIIRTVDGVGADGVILIGQCCDAYSLECVRASMGSMFSVPLYQASLEGFLALAKGWPGAVIATALNENTVDFRAADYKQPLILVMGNEQAGITPAMQEAVQQCVKLPMNGRADSLNLAIATGIMLYAAMEKWK